MTKDMSTVKIYQNAKDKRNCFCCLVPLINELIMDDYREVRIENNILSGGIADKISEIYIRLGAIFSSQYYFALNLNPSDNFSLLEFVAALKLFRNGPLWGASPADLTYINSRIKLIIALL